MRRLRETSFEVETDWRNITNSGAQASLHQIKEISDIGAQYGHDSTGHSVVGSVLTHAIERRGEVARRSYHQPLSLTAGNSLRITNLQLRSNRYRSRSVLVAVE